MNPQEILAEIVEQFRSCWRFRWLAAGIAWAVSVVGWWFVYSIPDVYEASTRVYVDTNTLLKPLMQGLTAQQNTMDEVELVSTAVLARPNLEAVARQTDLALRAQTPAQLEDLVTGLQDRIRVRGGRDNIFTIEFQDTSREMARAVVAAILEAFTQDAIVAQGDDAEITEQALSSEIRDHEERLNRADAALAQFKKDNIGYMPGESGDYYSRLQTALSQVTAARERIRQLEGRRDELARQLEGEAPVFGIVPSAGGGGPLCSQRSQLRSLGDELSTLLINFTEKHPRVVALQETIAVLEQRCAAEAAATGPVIPAAVAGSEPLEMNPVYQNMRIQQSNAEIELADARSQLQSYESAVAALRRDVDKIAEVETQLKQLNRDYDVVQSRHQQLLSRWEDLQAKKRLDPLTDNVQFRRIEPPFALAEPVGPDRPMLLGAVLFFAIGAGGAIAFGISQLRPVYFTRRSMRRLSGVPVLGSVTMVLTPGAAMRRRLGAFTWVVTYLLLFGTTAALIQFSTSVAEVLRSL